MKSIQTQEQKQKTVVEGVTVHSSDTSKYVFCGMLLLCAAFMVAWQFMSNAQHVVICLVAIGIVALVIFMIGHWIWHELFIRHYERRQIQDKSHFFLIGDKVIGDETTHNYRYFSDASTHMVNSVQDEPMGMPQETYEQINDRSIWNAKQQGRTWQDIVDTYDKNLDVTVSKCRSAYQRHQSRINAGDTHVY